MFGTSNFTINMQSCSVHTTGSKYLTCEGLLSYFFSQT